jgi:hypothetical protein
VRALARDLLADDVDDVVQQAFLRALRGPAHRSPARPSRSLCLPSCVTAEVRIVLDAPGGSVRGHVVGPSLAAGALHATGNGLECSRPFRAAPVAERCRTAFPTDRDAARWDLPRTQGHLASRPPSRAGRSRSRAARPVSWPVVQTRLRAAGGGGRSTARGFGAKPEVAVPGRRANAQREGEES